VSFIILTFLSCSRAGTEDTQFLSTFSKTNQKEPVPRRMANNDLSLLLDGMGFVIKDQRKGVPKNRRGFLKADSMFLKVARRFIVVPFKL
jgi:hypothetical protein